MSWSRTVLQGPKPVQLPAGQRRHESEGQRLCLRPLVQQIAHALPHHHHLLLLQPDVRLVERALTGAP